MLLRQSAVVGVVSVVTAMCGCAGMNHTQNGALVGTGVGAATGAIIGHQTGNRDAGALIGAAVGGIGGALAGNAADMQDQRDAAIVQAAHAEQARSAAARALTNADVVQMTQAGVGDSVILSTIRSRGGRFDTSPQSIVSLKHAGVSDTVIESMLAPPATTVVPAQPSTVIVAPPAGFYVAPRPRTSVNLTIGPRPYSRRYFRRHWHYPHHRRHHHH